MVGVEVFKAAVTLPRDEALLPVVLTIPMVALAALAATRVMAAWKDGEKR